MDKPNALGFITCSRCETVLHESFTGHACIPPIRDRKPAVDGVQDAKNQAQADVLKIVDAACIDEQYTPEKRRLLRNVAITGADMGFVAGMEFAISQISQHLSGKAGK